MEGDSLCEYSLRVAKWHVAAKGRAKILQKRDDGGRQIYARIEKRQNYEDVEGARDAKAQASARRKH